MSTSLIVLFVAAATLASVTFWVPVKHFCRRCLRKISGHGRSLIALPALMLVMHGAASGQLTVQNGISTVIGNGVQGFAGDGGPAASASIGVVYSTASDAQGNLYIADFYNERIRKVTASTGIITTIAGTGNQGYSGDGGPATSATFYYPEGIAVDKSGNLYVSDTYNHVVRKIDTNGIITTVAGNGNVGNTGDGGAGTLATLYYPQSLAVDAAGNVYIPDYTNAVVRKLTVSTGIITTVAGTGTFGYSGDGGAATQAKLYYPFAVSLDSAGNLFIADTATGTIRKVAAATGIITTVAGDDMNGAIGDGGPATSAFLYGPYGVAVDAVGNIYIADTGDSEIRRVDAVTGIIDRVAGNGSQGYSGDGSSAPSASFTAPAGITLDSKGFVYVMDSGNYRIRKVEPFYFAPTAIGSSTSTQNLLLETTAAEKITGPITVPMSQGGKQEYTVGTVTGCATDGVTSNPAGTVCTVPITFTPAYPGQRSIPLQVTTSVGKVRVPLKAVGMGPLATFLPGTLHLIAGAGGNGVGSGVGGPATAAYIDPISVKVDAAGNVYFADAYNDYIGRIDATTGVLTSVAGQSGSCGNTGDGGLATSATTCGIQGMALDAAGNIYLADVVHSTIRKVDSATGIITTIAGNGSSGYSGDGGPATSAELDYPRGMVVDLAGNLYVADNAYNIVRRIDGTTGIITTFAGIAVNGNGTDDGDGGQATAANLSGPQDVAIDSVGNIYIVDAKVVRMVNPTTGIISTYAGSLTSMDTSNNIPAKSARIAGSQTLAFDAADNLYMVNGNSVVVKIEKSSGILRYFAGAGQIGLYPVDGVSANAVSVGGPFSVALDGAGNAYIADFSYYRIIKVTPDAVALTYPNTTNVGTLDTTDGPRSILLNNIGNTRLIVSPPAVGTNPTVSPAWSVDPTSTCSQIDNNYAAYSVLAGASCNFTISFTPTVSGANTGSLVLTDNSLNLTTSTQTVGLSGTGAGTASVATISLSPTSISFADTPINTSSATTSITVSNTGTATANISGITIGGTGASSFSRSTNCAMTLASGSSCTITVTFTPTAAQSFSASLSVVSNDPNSPATTMLMGKGVNVTPTASVGGPYTGTTGSAITFDATGSSDPRNETLSYSWDFGDNSTGTGARPTHTYATGGTFTVKLTVTDTDNNTASSSTTATITTTYSAALSPTSYNFGNVNEASSATQTFTLTNNSTTSITVTSVQLASEASNSYTSSNNCTTLAANATCAVIVTFGPKTVGSIATTLTIKDDAGTQTASITGTGVALTATLTPATFDFGNVKVGTTATQVFTLKNTSATTIAVSKLLLNTEATNSYSSSTTCGTSLAAGATCPVTVTFKPTLATAISTTLTATDDAGIQMATVTGAGTQTKVTLSPTVIAFGSNNQGVAISPQTVTLLNSGNITLNIISIGVTGSGSSAYATGGTCGTTLAAGKSCSITITMSSAAGGTFNASLTVVDDDASSPQTVPISGQILTPAQGIFAPTMLDFGNVVAGTTSNSMTLTLSNPGSNTLAIGLASVSSSLFAITGNTCGTFLIAGNACTFTLIFSPKAVGIQNATFSLVDDLGTQTVPLKGTGIQPTDFSITVSPNPGLYTYNEGTVTLQVTITSLDPTHAFVGSVGLSGQVVGIFCPGFIATPSQMAPGATPIVSTVVLGCVTKAQFAQPHATGSSRTYTLASGSLAGVGMLLLLLRRRRRKLPMLGVLLLAATLLPLALATTGCGYELTNITGSGTGTITGTNGIVTHTVNFTVINDPNHRD